jgi:hypothetical protein
MHASQQLRPPPSRFDGHLGVLAMFVVAAITVAIIKPWGTNSGAPVLPPNQTPSPRPSPSPTLSAQLGFNGLVYDPTIFGIHEPEATWGIWPAGYLTTFGFVVQVPGAESPAPASSHAPEDRPTPSTAAGSGAADDGGPIWPSRFVVPEGDHLFLIGINTPRGYVVTSAQLARYSADGDAVDVGIQQFKPPWPHFAVFGIPTSAGGGRLDVWPAGRYRLDLAFDPGRISRSIEIEIDGPGLDPVASPTDQVRGP